MLTAAIPADIALVAMDLISSGVSPDDAPFFAALDEEHACCDQAWAKAYAKAHWDSLSALARDAYGHVFGRRSRRYAFDQQAYRDEGYVLARQERYDR